MKKRILSLLLAVVLLVGMMPMITIDADAASRYSVVNNNHITGQDIVNEARKWANVGAKYWSGVDPWLPSICWRTGYTYDGQTSFDCSGFVGRVLNDCGLRSSGYTPSYGNCILKQEYGSGYIGISIEELVKYGTDITSAVQKAKNGDYSDLVPGDIIGWVNSGRHIIIYAGLKNGTPWMVEFTGSGYLDRAITPSYQSKFESGARLVERVSHIEESYPCYGWIEITSSSSYVKSLPCSEKTDPNSVNVESDPMRKGAYYEAIGLYMNDQGNLWYKVKTGGTTGYVYAGDTTFLYEDTDLELTGVKAPTELKKGSTFSVTGIVSTQLCRLRGVHVFIYSKTDGTYPSYTQAHVDVDTTRYDLSHKDVDYKVKFDQLPVGEYIYYIAADVRSCYAKNAKEWDYTITQTITLHESTFSVVANTSCSHSYTSSVTPPTCTEKGYTTYKCTKCGYSYTGNTTNPTGHSYSDWYTTIAPGCTSDGTQQSACSACGDIRERTVNATGHSYSTTHVGATCTEPGKTVYTCAGCGDTYAEYDYGYTDWSEAYPEGVDPSLIESRTEYRSQSKRYTTGSTDTMSGWTLYDTTAQWGAYGSWSDWSDTSVAESDSTKVETRTVYKYYYYSCPSCGAHMHGWNITCPTWAGGCGKAKIPDNYTAVWSTTSYDKAGLSDFHGTGKYSAIIDGQRVFQSTPTSKTQYRYCTRSLETVYHFYQWSEWSDWSVTAISASDDVNVETRTVYRYIESGMSGHSYVETVIVPTCTTAGYTSYTCSKCGDSYTGKETAPTGHDYVEEVVPPTCVDSGYTSHTCSKCGDKYTDNTVPATGHAYTPQIVQIPTETQIGSMKAVCGNCDHSVNCTLPILDNVNYSYEVIREPDGGQPGLGRYTWIQVEYGLVIFEVEIPALPAPSEPDPEPDPVSDYTYTVTDGKATITAANVSGDVVIPAELDGYTVVAIGDSVFEGNAAITSVVIPNTVTLIGERAFEECTSLTEVTIGTGVKTIPLCCFYACKNLTTVMLGMNVERIEHSAFGGCNIQNINLHNRLQFIGKFAFSGLNISHLIIPDSVTEIGENAFSGAAIETLTIGRGLTSIPAGAFEYCDSLRTIVIPKAVMSIRLYAFYKCTSIKEVYYGGSEDSWKNVSVGSNNEPFLNAIFHYTEESVLYGDVNGDGNVNTKDRMVLTRYLAGMTGYTADMIDMKAADVNCDGTVNAKDRMILTRYLAQWTAYPALPHVS